MQSLVVKGRYLYSEDGKPFFWLGDTAWELFHRLSTQEATLYLRERARQGFSVIQCVALAENEGVTKPGPCGRLPLLFTDGTPDPTRPDTAGPDSYWDHVDRILDEMERLGLYAAILPCWGDKFNLKWGHGPEIFDPENAYVFARWLGERCAERKNVIWMLGGDRPPETAKHYAVIEAMARGLLETDPAKLITYHTYGPHKTTEHFPGAPWLDLHTAQSGHATDACFRSDSMMLEMRQADTKPYLDAEPRYEDHPAAFREDLGKFWGAAEVRQNLYWNLCAGVCGHTYGNHCIWSFNREPGAYFPYAWQDVLCRPGAEQLHHAVELRLRRDYASFRPAPELLLNRYFGRSHLAAGMGKGYAYLYSPQGLPLDVNPAPLGAKLLKALWFDPRSGEETLFSLCDGSAPDTFVPPTRGEGNDWLLILEDAGEDPNV